MLIDLKLIVKKAYISSDGRWFMAGKFLAFFLFFCFSGKNRFFGDPHCVLLISVFNVTNRDGDKVRHRGVISYIKKVRILLSIVFVVKNGGI